MKDRRSWTIVAGITLAIFIVLAALVTLRFDPLFRLDIATVKLFTPRPWLLEQAMLAVTNLGGTVVITVVSVTTGILLFARRHPLWKTLVVTMLGSLIATQAVKFVVERSRPDALYAAYHESYFSFPSSHATMSAALFGFLGLLAAHHARKRERVPILLVAGGAALLIGFSRVYLGVHYPSDVLAGFALGVCWLALGTRFASRL